MTLTGGTPNWTVLPVTTAMDSQSSDSGTMLQQREQETLQQLCELLRGYGEKILSGQSKLSLTTRSLCILNESFISLPGSEELATSFDVVPPNSHKLHLAQDIQFLYDFMQKTIALKILHISSTLQGRVNLRPFKALRSLEIKKTPLHLLEGIQRMRGRLSTIICARSLSSLQELFETCGGDLSNPMSWPELRTAGLSFNMIEKLDSSLRLVPRLEVLDLSHNSIKDTNHYLEFLTDVSIVNLGYNQISEVPTFAISARAKLSTLILRNNNMDSLNGVGELIGLRELDVSDNCLCSHATTLHQLRTLHRLHVLVLKGNPLGFHDSHRLLTIIQLHHTAVNRVTLDGQPISQAEIQAAQKKIITSSTLPKPKSPGQSSALQSGTSQSSLEVSLDTGPVSDTDTTLSHPGRARHSGRAARRVRRAPISDLDSGCDAEVDPPLITPDTSMPSTPGTTEHLDVKMHLETMRNQLGPDWLQTLVHSRTHRTQGASTQPADGSAGTSPITALRPAGASYLAPSRPCPGHVSDQSSVTGESCRERTAQFAIGSLDEDDDDPKELLAGDCGTIAKEELLGQQSMCQESGRKLSPETSHEDQSDRLSAHMWHDGNADDVEVSKNSDLIKSAEFDTIYDRQLSQPEEVDYGAESEPFIVSLLSDADTHHLVSVTQRYLLEKDINGDVIEALDLRCLLSAKCTPVNEERLDDSASDIPDGRLLKLTFDHIKKDKKVRLYLIEDEISAETLQELLQPIVNANQADASIRDQMHCLKCSREFSKRQCSRTIRRHASLTGTIGVFTSTGVEREDLTEVRLCPFCGSDMLIAVEKERKQPEAMHTPTGSFMEPLATSSAKPSPWNKTDSPVNMPNKNRPVFGSLQSTSSFHSAVETPAVLTPKTDSMFLNTNSSQSDLSAFTTAEESNDISEDQLVGATPTGTMWPMLKPFPMLQVSSQATLYAQQQSDFNKNLVFEKRTANGVQKNLSSQDLAHGNYRKRQDSGSSDILVLSHHPPPVGGVGSAVLSANPSMDSEITLISNPSQSSIAVIDSAICSSERLNEIAGGGVAPKRGSLEILRSGQQPSSGQLRVSEMSPSGSLTNKTLSSMVSSVYEKSIFDVPGISNISANDDGEVSGEDTLDGVTVVDSSFNSSASLPHATPHNLSTSFSPKCPAQFGNSVNGNQGEANTEVAHSLPTGQGVGGASGVTGDMEIVRFSYTDYTQIDHRLKLYLMMNVCNHDDEDLLLVNRCGLWNYAKGEEVPGLVVISSHLIYFFKVIGPEKVENPERWLKLLQSRCVGDLCYVDIGLGHQTVRLEFGSDAGCFMLLIRDETRCKRFTRQFTVHMQSLSFSTQSKLESITKNHPGTLENIQKQVLEGVDPDFPEDETLVRFVMAYQHTGEVTVSGEKHVRPVSVVVTSTCLHLVDEDFNWKAPRGSVDSQCRASSVRQFTRKDRQRITNVTHLDFYQSAPLDINIAFYDEESSEECAWRIALETRDSLTSLVQSVQVLWEEQFGVDLQINYEEA